MSIDQSLTCTGLCIFQDSKLVHFECIKTTKQHSVVERISIISNRVCDLHTQYAVTDVVAEQLSYGSMGDATRNLAGLLFVIETKLFEKFGNEVIKLAPTAIKKFATGNGRAKKKDMMEALPKVTYDKFYDAGYLRSKGLADLADAYFIGMMRLNEMPTHIAKALAFNELIEI